MLSLSFLTLSPERHIAREIACMVTDEMDKLSKQFQQILSIIINYRHLTEFWGLVGLLDSVKLTENEWRVLICIFERNSLLGLFIESRNHTHAEQLKQLFSFLIGLLS